jgi:hypothetical protein
VIESARAYGFADERGRVDALWPKQWGLHPYTDRHEDKVLEIKWGEASIYCPPGDWFHQHFNTGKEPARHLAVRYGSRLHPLGFKVSHQRTDDDVFRSVEEGVG